MSSPILVSLLPIHIKGTANTCTLPASHPAY